MKSALVVALYHINGNVCALIINIKAGRVRNAFYMITYVRVERLDPGGIVTVPVELTSGETAFEITRICGFF